MVERHPREGGDPCKFPEFLPLGVVGAYLRAHDVGAHVADALRQIMLGAAVLEERFEIDHYLARGMVTAVLEAVSSGEEALPCDSSSSRPTTE